MALLMLLYLLIYSASVYTLYPDQRHGGSTAGIAICLSAGENIINGKLHKKYEWKLKAEICI